MKNERSKLNSVLREIAQAEDPQSYSLDFDLTSGSEALLKRTRQVEELGSQPDGVVEKEIVKRTVAEEKRHLYHRSSGTPAVIIYQKRISKPPIIMRFIRRKVG